MNPSNKPAPPRTAPHARDAQPSPPTAGRGRARRVARAWRAAEFVLCALPFLSLVLPTAADDGALRAWRANGTAALATHGPAGRLNTSGETGLSYLFKDARYFNEDLNRFLVPRVVGFDRCVCSDPGTRAWHRRLCGAMGERRSTRQGGCHATQAGRGGPRCVVFDSNGCRRACSCALPFLALVSWDVSSANYMDWMFGSAALFNGSLADWDTARVTDMYAM